MSAVRVLALFGGVGAAKSDSHLSERLKMPVHVAPTLMFSLQDKESLAGAVLKFAAAVSAMTRMRRANR